MTGTADTATSDVPTVDRTIDQGDVYVTIDFAAADVLTLLARAVVNDPALTSHFAILGLAESDSRRAAAVTALLADQRVVDALTITLGAWNASDLADDLVNAGDDLPCQGTSDRGHCDNQALDDTYLRCPDCDLAEERTAAARAARHLTACEADQ